MSNIGNKKDIFTNIHKRRVIIELQTPLHIGTGEYSELTDAPVIRDWNGLPYIPSSSLTGAISSLCAAHPELLSMAGHASQNYQDLLLCLFGGKISSTSNKEVPIGAQLFFSDALLLWPGYRVYDSLLDPSELTSDQLKFYKRFQYLPIRDYVKINDRGVAEQGQKFDQEVVQKGSRFVFDVTLESLHTTQVKSPPAVSKRQNEKLECLDRSIGSSHQLDEVLHLIAHPDYRLGAKETNGFGQITISDCYICHFDLTNDHLLQQYINWQNRFSRNDDILDIPYGNNEPTVWQSHDYLVNATPSWDLLKEHSFDKAYELQIQSEEQMRIISSVDQDMATYQLADTLIYRTQIDNLWFLHFGAGYGDEEVDDAVKQEEVILWDDHYRVNFTNHYLIPFSSIRGVIYHRMQYYYQLICPPIVKSDQGNTSRMISKEEFFQSFFGRAKDERVAAAGANDGEEGLISRFYGQDNYVLANDNAKKKQNDQTRIFMHNQLDRFTQAPTDGALFSERTLRLDQLRLWMMLRDYNPHDDVDQHFVKLLSYVLADIQAGRLPIGGKVNRGHGISMTDLIPNTK